MLSLHSAGAAAVSARGRPVCRSPLLLTDLVILFALEERLPALAYSRAEWKASGEDRD